MKSEPTLPSQGLLADAHPVDDDDRLRQLRALLIAPEIDQIAALRRRLDDHKARSEDLSHSIAEAIAIRAKQDHKLQTTLQPLIEEALRISVARDPQMLATSLFPIIGEAVRKAVAHALQGMFDSLNLMLSRGLSLESWRWRFEAWRTGKSFGQVALTHSLSYRVEQVFLIHRETGLLLGHLTFSDGVVQDADLISGMLTAIQDFVRDSFGPKKTDELEVMQVGEFKLWIQHGPLALLAAVVSGQPPPELRGAFEQELEAIHREFAPALQTYDGDASSVLGVEANLRRCLLGSSQSKVKKSHTAVWVIASLLLLGMATLFAFHIRDTRRWNRYIAHLQSEHGIVVVRSRRDWFSYFVDGLRDPLAIEPHARLAEFHVPQEKVTERWQPFLSLEPAFEAPRRLAAETLAVEHQVIRFDLDSSQLPISQFDALDAAAENIKSLQKTAGAMGRLLSIQVSGHTDNTGKEARNMELSQARAHTVVAALLQRHVAPDLLSASGLSDTNPEHNDADIYPHELDRRVTFHVHLTRPGTQR